MCHRSVLSLLIFLTVFMTGCSGLLNKTDNSIANLSSDPNFLKTLNELDSIVSQIDEKHSVRLCYKKRPVFTFFKYTLAPKSECKKVLTYLKLLQHELDKYPPTFLQEAGVKKIFVGRVPAVCAFADPVSKSIYYNYSELNTADVKRIIHHELYHLLEAKFNVISYFKDSDWAKLNSTDFKYGKGERHLRRNKSNSEKSFHPSAGFVTTYAKSALKEDKADVYAALFVEEISACLADWIKEDEILRNKVNYMKDFLLQRCDAMTSDFWANLCIGQCSEDSLSATALYEIQDSRFSVESSDDIAVELIAIGQGSGDSEKWWRPNGEILGEAPFTSLGDFKHKRGHVKHRTPLDDKLKRYRFFFYAGNRNDQSPWPIHKLDLPDGRFYQLQTPCISKGGKFCHNVWDAIGGLDKDKEATRITTGVPLDEWTVKATYNPETKVTGGTNHSVKFAGLRKKNGKFYIEVSHNIKDFRDTAQKIVAVDRAGEIRHSALIKSSVVGSEAKKSFRFSDLRLSQVKEFRFKTCPYTQITFENISLRPGQITDVLIKVANN